MIKQFVPEEVCLECKGCCRFKENNSVWLPCLMNEEIQGFLEKKIPPAAISADRKIQPVPDPSGEGFICAFLDHQNNQCKVYSFRPFECQLYPFLINLRNGKIILTVDLNCQYICQKVNSQEFKNHVEYLTAFLNSAPQKKLLKDNPQLLQTYEEVKEIVELDLGK